MLRGFAVSIVTALLVTSIAGPVGGVAAVGAPASGAPAEDTALQQCGFPVTYTDATGEEVTVEEEPESVVTLGPAATQTMYEIGAADKIVGATALSSFLPGSEEWADVGVQSNGRTQVSVEKVIAEDPDLVLAENVISDDQVTQLRDAGITVYKFDRATSLEFVYEKVHRTGALVGAHEGAAETVADMRYEVQVAAEAAASGESPRALYVFFGFTAGSNTFVDAIVTAAGGTNVATEAGIEGYKEISDEVVANQRVEWLLLNSGNPSVPDREAYQSSVAVQEDQTVVLNANNISQPAPRIADSIRKLSQAWYPEAHEAARQSVERPDVRPPCAPAATTVQSGTTVAAGTTATGGTTAAGGTTAMDGTEAATTAESGGGSPGFTAGVAAAAMLALTLLLRRRS